MGLFPSAPGGGEEVEHGYKGKGVLLHVLCEGNGLPLSCTVTAANGDERKEVDKLLDQMDAIRPQKILILEADRGYDSEKLRDALLQRRIYPVVAYRKRPSEKQARQPAPLLPKLRWKVERLHAWIKRSFRRLQSRWERKLSYWLGFIHCALIILWLKRLVG